MSRHGHNYRDYDYADYDHDGDESSGGSEELGDVDEWLGTAEEEYQSLSAEGQKTFRVIRDVMHGLLVGGKRGPWCFRETQERLQRALPGAVVEREGGQAQWTVTVKKPGRAQKVLYVAMRTVLPPGDAKGLASRIRVVKNVLLRHGREWMRSLTDDPDALDGFVHDCWEEGGAGGRNLQRDGWVCEYCGRDDMIGRRHLCTLWANFKCSSCRHQWYSHRAKYDVEKDEFLGQLCGRCKDGGHERAGRVTRSGPHDEAPSGRFSSNRPHRADLCLTCIHFGDCRGIFFDPFTVDVALQMQWKLTEQPEWRAVEGEDGNVTVFVAHRSEDDYVILVPHVYEE
eukprot:TRINITY_DN38918_c0_g1_i1.p1 TRINITY_DN38918_c0_g1~~TRINITY_DN38918_c0_g1_i1.p1  ORF type:complete len:372 (+),score=109.52 TRINITY_DN38918_c0_g1_i1:94-1116(+)